MCNFITRGALTLFLHDLAEIFVAICRIFIDLKRGKTIVILSYVGMVVTWAITRCYIFPLFIIIPMHSSAMKYEAHYNNYLMTGLACTLVVLHYYWLGLFIKIGYHLIVHK